MNCDNVLARVEPCEVNFRSLENFAAKVCGGRGFWNFFFEGGGEYLKWGGCF